MSRAVKKGLLARKLGMTQVFTEDGQAVAVTAIEAGPCVVVRKKTPETDGYSAIQVGFMGVKERKVNRPDRGQFAKAQIKPTRWLREFRVEDPDQYEIGQEIRADVFQEGDLIDVTGISKGKGFAGGIKRHNFHRGPMAHGSKYHRRPGSLGAKGPARVFKGRKEPGRLGGERVTVQRLKIVKVYPEKNVILVKGAVPGPRRGLLTIRDSVKA
ncbi:MAG: 50S ribosomal protein L3 [Syntrophomonadaceae bacterium]|nr:50S ribosomal protein L3 [Syntrophomonadaceae bacterium]